MTTMKNFREIIADIENAPLEEAKIDEVVVAAPLEEKIEKPKPKKEVVERKAGTIDPLAMPPAPRKNEKQLSESLKKVNEASTMIVEALTAQSKDHATSQKMIIEAIRALTETNKVILERLDDISNLELPAPIIQVAPPRSVKRDVVRHVKGENKGKIDYVVDNYEDDE